MMMFIWMCVFAQAFLPGGASIASLQAAAYEAHLRAELESPAPPSALLGAASHITRYQLPKLAPAI